VRKPLLLVALLVAACSGPSASGSPGPGTSATPGSSGTGACATAPTPPSDLEGWRPPSSTPAIIPVLIPTRLLTCGPNRILFSLLDKDERPVAAPDRSVSVALYNLGRDAQQPIATSDGTFIWAIEDARGVYELAATFPEAGVYGAAFTIEGGAPSEVRLTFDVRESSPTVKAGDRAPASKTPTLADVGGDISKISTDAHPDPAFYQTSVDTALADHKPFALVFATPKFCTSAQCGPTLDRIKPFVTKYPGVAFINVEPYQLEFIDGALTAVLDAQGYPKTTAVTDEWQLSSEPAVFVVNGQGIVTASFDLIFSDAELTAALDAVK
jgi:hypothetical protein